MTDLVAHLVRLGLSEYEARAYIAIVSLGDATVAEISKESGVPRSRAYDVMERLAEKGFVGVGDSTPICYHANKPTVVSNLLMNEIKYANDEILKQLDEIGKKAEKRENPVWSLKGEFAIDQKITELIESARSEITLVILNNQLLIHYAKLIAKVSEHRRVMVLLSHQPESFVGLLGNCKLMRIQDSPILGPGPEGTLSRRGYTTKDGNYTIELALFVDQATSLILTLEHNVRRAIIINGTILDYFSREAISRMVISSEEVGPDLPAAEKKA